MLTLLRVFKISNIFFTQTFCLSTKPLPIAKFGLKDINNLIKLSSANKRKPSFIFREKLTDDNKESFSNYQNAGEHEDICFGP